MPSELFIAQLAAIDVKSRSCFGNTELHSLLSVPQSHSLNHQNDAFNRFHAKVVHGIYGYIGGRQ